MSAAEATQLNAGQGHFEKLNQGRVCRFTEAAGFKTDVAIFDGLGLDDIVANGPPTPVPTLGRHKAVQSMGGIRSCVISIEVTKTSRVDAVAAAGTDEKKACEIALQVAKLVEPKLP